MDANGNFLWAKSMGSNTTDLVYAITLDAAGNVHTTGTFHNAVDFDPGLGVYTLLGNTDVLVQKLDPNGNFIWARALVEICQTIVMLSKLTCQAMYIQPDTIREQ